MKFLVGSTLQKVLAAIVAAVMSFSVLTPAISNIKSNHKPTGIVQTVKKVDGKIVAVTPEVKATEETTEEEQTAPEVQEEEATAPEAETEEATAPEAETEEATAPEAQTEETTAPEENSVPEPIAQWDVSATDEDDVQMYYYADDSFLDTIAGAVKALFVPMTAFAEENEGQEEESTTLASGVTYRGGTIYITGEGSTQEMIFFNLIKDYKKFAQGYESYCANSGVGNDRYYVNYNNLDDGCIIDYWNTKSADDVHAEFYCKDENGNYILDENNKNVVNYEEMFRTYFPWNLIDMVLDTDPHEFWTEYGTFIPSKVVIDTDVTSIGYAAFAFCSSITELDFLSDSKMTNIGIAAFAGTSLDNVFLPNGVTEIGMSAFEACYDLDYVSIPSSVTTIGYAAFYDIALGSTIKCGSFDVLLLFDEESYTPSETGNGSQGEYVKIHDSTRTTVSL